jgi:acyl-coenzyme A synthetase/AMP-(fatty) acid ligase
VIWSEEAFGKPFHDTFWQTETGAMMITNYPGMEVKPGSMGKPFPGITGRRARSQDLRADHRAGQGGPDRVQARLAVACSGPT